MPRSHSRKEDRQAVHVAASERARGVSAEEAERIGWATVQKRRMKASKSLVFVKGTPAHVASASVALYRPGVTPPPAGVRGKHGLPHSIRKEETAPTPEKIFHPGGRLDTSRKKVSNPDGSGHYIIHAHRALQPLKDRETAEVSPKTPFAPSSLNVRTTARQSTSGADFRNRMQAQRMNHDWETGEREEASPVTHHTVSFQPKVGPSVPLAGKHSSMEAAQAAIGKHQAAQRNAPSAPAGPASISIGGHLDRARVPKHPMFGKSDLVFVRAEVSSTHTDVPSLDVRWKTGVSPGSHASSDAPTGKKQKHPWSKPGEAGHTELPESVSQADSYHAARAAAQEHVRSKFGHLSAKENRLAAAAHERHATKTSSPGHTLGHAIMANAHHNAVHAHTDAAEAAVKAPKKESIVDRAKKVFFKGSVVYVSPNGLAKGEWHHHLNSPIPRGPAFSHREEDHGTYSILHHKPAPKAADEIGRRGYHGVHYHPRGAPNSHMILNPKGNRGLFSSAREAMAAVEAHHASTSKKSDKHKEDG